ncbi:MULTISPECIES: hypothetical protein [unclassified Ruegeria]|uniref:hypothetical protein n=1 Tax=unclassified Ruegeria TaxID=2625375 RepID=UPI001488E9FE|nr:MULTISPECIES: hypothetical protein [unclassified Ruegeria]NOD62187.1 hypothetical protein [Ruegeria sp. HKCCD6109]
MTHPETWADQAIPGLFARIATGQMDPDSAFGPPGRNLDEPLKDAPFIPQFNDWPEVTKTCQMVAASFPELAADGGVTDADQIVRYREYADRITPTLMNAVIQSQELHLSVDPKDMLFIATPLTVRAHLANEMLSAVRDGWNFMQCDHCGAWHRIRRTRPVSMCSNRCKTAAHRARQAEEAN